MYSIVNAAILFHISFAIETTLAAENGYIVSELNIQCQEPTTNAVSSTCVGFVDYNIPDLNTFPKSSGLSNFSLFNTSKIIQLGQALRPFGESCSNAGVKYFCEAAHPLRCEDQYIRVDLNELQATCNKAKEECFSFPGADKAFNCSLITIHPALQQNIPRKLVCGAFPVLKNDPFTCEANYKVS